MFAHISHLPQEVTACQPQPFPLPGKGRGKDVPGFFCHLKLLSDNIHEGQVEFYKQLYESSSQPVNAAKESKVKLKPLLKQDLLPSFVHVP